MNHVKLGNYALVKLELPVATGANIWEIAKASRPTPNIKLVLDVSGSMKESMMKVLATSLATVDALENGSFIEILCFDTSAFKIVDKVRYYTPKSQNKLPNLPQSLHTGIHFSRKPLGNQVHDQNKAGQPRGWNKS